MVWDAGGRLSVIGAPENPVRDMRLAAEGWAWGGDGITSATGREETREHGRGPVSRESVIKLVARGGKS